MKRIILIILILFITPFIVKAEGMTLSITPPLIKNNIDPGSVWQSSIKVINNNAQEIEVYIDVVDFEGGDGAGTVKFLPPSTDPKADEFLLSRWIQIDRGPIKIGGFKSKEINYIIDVPQGASPGGHYTALITGTKPNKKDSGGAGMSISTKLSSLILLNVNGEVEEKGVIREFSSSESFYKTPDVDFNIVFENTGNIHIQPQGEIRVYDLFNKDKGAVTINRSTEFGNVLPGTKRNWEFNWKGEDGVLNMGRYKAELILGYGEEARKTENMFLFFWVIDFKILAFVIGPILIFLLIVFVFVKLSIRKAIKQSREAAGIMEPRKKRSPVRISAKKKKKHIVNLKEE